ncbi:NAD-dependent epimerase/dehydratase family protein [Streptomyces sp. NPDC058469]|uniref:NAD-dependent epimerase/dehydratase family protein n=1 Tax=Streptomyces sp. NPDC058469 TaxID=3346514 RepID=UPI0036602692
MTGRREFTEGGPSTRATSPTAALVDRIFVEHPDIEAVVHCAALILVPDSVADPVGYYRANVVKSLELVSHLLRNGCGRMIFSSSGSIYAAGEDFSVTEESPLEPTSPYARSKAVCEGMFADIAATRPIRILSLRYFNPVGADPRLRTGLQLRRPGHAVGKLIEAHAKGEPFRITGTDWPTRDGSGIRDYIHVWDLAGAHVSALQRFDEVMTGSRRSDVINRGTGTGTTVNELVDAFNSVVTPPVGRKLTGQERPRPRTPRWQRKPLSPKHRPLPGK